MTGSYVRQNPDVTGNTALAPGTAPTNAELGRRRSAEADDVPPPPYQETVHNEGHNPPGPPLPRVQSHWRAQAQLQPQPAMASYPSRNQASSTGQVPPNAYTPMSNQQGRRPMPAQSGTTTYPTNTFAQPHTRYAQMCAPGMHSYEVQYGVSALICLFLCLPSPFFCAGLSAEISSCVE